MEKLTVWLKKIFKSAKGFTLIELLVVIGILGVLAATLVATIDPFEQIKKANDTKVQNATVEFETALIRYYTGQNAFPWWVDASACQGDSTSAQSSPYNIDAPVTLEAAKSCITDLATIGELKPSFTQVQGVLDKIYLASPKANDGTAIRPVVCYRPTSKAGLADKNVVYSDQLGTLDNTNCPGDKNGATCYWCTQ